MVSPCVRAVSSARLRLALCAVKGEEGGGRGGGVFEDSGNNAATLTVERNHLRSFMKAAFVRLDGSIKD